MRRKQFNCLDCGAPNEFGTIWCKSCYSEYEYKPSLQISIIGGILGILLAVFVFSLNDKNLVGLIDIPTEGKEWVVKLILAIFAGLGISVISQFSPKYPYLKLTDKRAEIYEIVEADHNEITTTNVTNDTIHNDMLGNNITRNSIAYAHAHGEDFPLEKMTLDNPQYRLWLVKRYEIERNELLGEVICGEKSFKTAEEALGYAHSVQITASHQASPSESPQLTDGGASIEPLRHHLPGIINHPIGPTSSEDDQSVDPPLEDYPSYTKNWQTFKAVVIVSAVVLFGALAFVWIGPTEANQVSVTVDRDANLRDGPDTSGTVVVDKVFAGTSLTGRWVEGQASQPGRWLEIVRSGKKLYVWDGNLAAAKSSVNPAAISARNEFDTLNDEAIRAGRQCYIEGDQAACPKFESLFGKVAAQKSGETSFCRLEVTAYVSYSVPCKYQDKYWNVFSGGTFGEASP